MMCEKCLSHMDSDYTYFTLHEEDFRVEVFYCKKCNVIITKIEKLSIESKQYLHEQVKNIFGFN